MPDPTPRPRLRAVNLALAALHGGQAAALVVLSNDFSLPVTTTFASGPPGEPVDASRLDEWFSLRLGPAVAAFLAVSAVFHLMVALPGVHRTYLHELDAGRNRFRWVEYSVSASIMVVLIAQLTGISDAAALIALFGVNAAMILFGWTMEVHNDPDVPVDWAPFVFGCIAGIVPWVAIGLYLVGAGSDVPTFVYGIFVSLFVLFNSFAVNQWLQYARVGPWRRYVVGEGGYMVLSLVAKSALAWQVFANTLV